MSCLNPFDVQSRHIMTTDGQAESLYAGCGMRGGQQYVLVKRMTKYKTYGISAYESNSMKSSNPHSGIYEADTTRTLDLNGGNPACNQGGMIICQAVFEGNGCQPSHQGLGIKAGDSEMYTLNSTEVHGVITERSIDMESEYDVRRLTPTECARLQGFPPDWCADVPHSDSAEYKLWGNGIALPSILGIMQNAVNLVKEYKHEHIQRSKKIFR